MSEVISVRFRSGNKTYYFDPGEMNILTGQEVIVETAQGLEFGICTRANHEISESTLDTPLSPVLRLATDADRRTVEHHKKRETDAFSVGMWKIAEHGLEMKLVDVSATFDGNKLIFYFTADGRVDFRALVRDLASYLHCRIELRQIGVRDEAKMIGGIGICGRTFCCAQFLNTFMPVSIKMAKTQNLSLNPSKISGACGRLMCCLKYEQYAYEDAVRRLPKMDSFVQTPDGPGNVKAVDLLRETVKVALDPDPEHPRTYRESEIILLRNGKGSREGIEIPDRPERCVEEKREETFSLPFGTYENQTAPQERKRNNKGGGLSGASNERRNARDSGDNRDKRRAGKGGKSGQNKAARKRDFYEGDPKHRRQKAWYQNNRRNSKGGM